MAFYAMSCLKITSVYGLYPSTTDGASLMFTTVNFSRIAAPLVYNFIDLLKL